MADPLSITASIIAVTQLAGKVVSYLRDVKDASSECKGIMVEVSLVRGLLTSLHETAEASSSASWASALGLLNCDKGLLAQVHKLLEGLCTQFEKTASGRKITQFTKALQWPFQKNQADSILKNLQRHKMLLTLALQNDHLALSREIQDEVHSISATVNSIHTNLQDHRHRQDDLETQELLRWVSPLNFRSKQSDILAMHEGSTGSWILESEQLQTWIKGTSKTLFCQGIPGAGKTIIASVIVHHLQTTFPADQAGVACVYLSQQESQRAHQQSTTNLLGSLIRQLEEHRPSDMSTLKDLQARFRDRRRESLVDTFSSVLEGKIKEYQRLFVVVDGLDECSTDTREEFIDILERLGPQVNMALMSRDITPQEAELDNMVQMKIRATSEDLTAYVDARIHSSKHLRKHISCDASLRERLQTSINASATGMFLMAKLHLDLLDKQARRSKGALVRAISKLPESLDATYDDAIDRINSQSSEDVDTGHRVLSWVWHSPQPLHVRQLQHALAILPGDQQLDEDLLDSPEYLLTKCAGLVEVDRTIGLVRFVHATVLGYLSRNPQKLNKGMDELAQTCLTYIQTSNFLEDTAGVSGVGEIDQALPLHDSSRSFQDVPTEIRQIDLDIFEFREKVPFTTFVVEQLHLLLDENLSEESEALLMALFFDYDHDRLWRYYDTRRWLSLYLGLGEAVLDVLRMPLLLAVELDLPQIVFRILQEGQHQSTCSKAPLKLSKEAPSQPAGSTLALSFAAFHGRINVLKGLLANGADTDTPTQPFTVTGTVIKTSTLDDLATFTLNSPLYYAIRGGQLDIVEALLDSGASLQLDAPDHPEHPLRLAIEKQNPPILKLLLARGDPASVVFEGGETVLHLAVRRPNITCLNILLESGAAVDAKNGNNESPLYIAVILSNQSAVSSLVRFGASPKALLDCPKDDGGKMDKLEPLLTQETDEDLRRIFRHFSGASIILDATCALGLFRQLLSLALSESCDSQDSQDSHLRIEDVDPQFARFTRWCGHIGVFAGGYDSLDHRLRTSETQSHLTNELRCIQSWLKFAIDEYRKCNLSNPSAEGNDVDHLSISPSSIPSISISWSNYGDVPLKNFNIAIRFIENVIDALYRISAPLRSATHNMNRIATNHKITDEEGNDIDSAFASYALQRTKFRFPKAEEGVLQRIADAITRRRRYFQFRQKLQDQLKASHIFKSTKALRAAQTRQATNVSDSENDAGVKEGLSQATSSSLGPGSGGGERVIQETSAMQPGAGSQFNEPLEFGSVLDASSIGTTSTTSSGYREHIITVPPIPNIPTGSKEVECPYCFMVLFKKDLTAYQWKRHVLMDLRPYLCLAVECADQDKLFHNRKQWIRHMQDHAPIWNCPRNCETFKSIDDIKIHLSTAHSAAFGEETVKAIVNASKTYDPIGLFASCPLCGFKPDHSSPSRLYRHLGGHLEVLSLISLPWVADDETMDAEKESGQYGSLRASLLQSQKTFISNSEASHGRREAE